ncbi:XdhC family protein [Ketobacter sp.]|uniref:XdhC family protein n=1 Tax=Ketobacter sp. TaxID=2083498 RepID=UPI000F298CCF|nr:XdhC family protein [Ketobacter sp.]RLT95672.1 MAG: XdhC family protein [Ketobacter sp.]
MHSLDHQVLATLQGWIADGHCAWLCTIVATHGSSPRPAGSLMACNQNGQVVGALSGGCVEDDLVAKLLSGGTEGFPTLVEYGLNAEENARLGLPCGGYLTVLVEKLDVSNLNLLRAVNDRLERRACIERSVDLETGVSSLRQVTNFKPFYLSEEKWVQVYGPRYTLLLVGAGQIAGCLTQMGSLMDYRVVVTDPRADKLDDFQTHIIGPEQACECVLGMPDDVVRQYGSDPFSIVITLTHDPRIDDMALMEALTRDNLYVGALGSLRTTEQRIARLRQLDVTEAQLQRLHAPVGLSIGSKTAPEIAVSVLAELTQLRRKRERS